MTTFQSNGDVAEAVVNRWQWWQNALTGNFGPIYEVQPEDGYYRTKRKGGEWEPVAIWFDEDLQKQIAYRNGRDVKPDEVWTWCCQNPITYEAYQKAIDTGAWDDLPPPAIGDNSGDVDPFEALKIELAGEIETTSHFLKSSVESQADADKAAIWSKRLGELAKRAEIIRVAEKQPFLDGGRAVDAKWKEITDAADAKSKQLKKHVEPFLIAQRRAEEERQRKAREAAEALRRQADEAARMAMESNAQVDNSAELLAQAKAAEADAEARKLSAGRTGARVSIRIEKVGVVTDYAIAAASLVAMNHPDIKATIDQLANRAAKAGMPFAGMEVKEVEKAV